MKKMLYYFGYGTNRDLRMLAAIIGRDEIKGVPGKLNGYELCIQRAKDIPDDVLRTAPVPKSPRAIVTAAFDKDFELYIIRPKKKAATYGTIWKITKEEFELIREWELLEFGMQEDMTAEVEDSSGKRISVVTHGSRSSTILVNRVIKGSDYEDYIIPKKKILNVARRVRKEYLERVGKQ